MVLFENSYTRNKEWAKEIYGYIAFKRPSIIVCFALSAVYFVFGTIYLIVDNEYNLFMFMLLPLLLLIQSLVYFQNVRMVEKRDIETHGKAVEASTVVTIDAICQTFSTGSVNQLDYNNIKKVVQTKNYIFLYSKANLLYTLKKDSFSIGSFEEFLTFLQNKGIKIK